MLSARPQVYDFTSSQGDLILIADPLAGIQLSTLLSRALSRALHSPLVLPMEPLLSCAAADLSVVRQALLPPSPTTGGGVSCLYFPCIPHSIISRACLGLFSFSYWTSQQKDMTSGVMERVNISYCRLWQVVRRLKLNVVGVG